MLFFSNFLCQSFESYLLFIDLLFSLFLNSFTKWGFFPCESWEYSTVTFLQVFSLLFLVYTIYSVLQIPRTLFSTWSVFPLRTRRKTPWIIYLINYLLFSLFFLYYTKYFFFLNSYFDFLSFFSPPALKTFLKNYCIFICSINYWFPLYKFLCKLYEIFLKEILQSTCLKIDMYFDFLSFFSPPALKTFDNNYCIFFYSINYWFLLVHFLCKLYEILFLKKFCNQPALSCSISIR